MVSLEQKYWQEKNKTIFFLLNDEHLLLMENDSFSNRSRCYVIYSAAMTIDGKIATYAGDSELSDLEDWNDVHKLRLNSDAIMVGISTILVDNPKLTVKFHENIKKFPYRIIVDSRCRTPLNSHILNYLTDRYTTIIATTTAAKEANIEKLKENGAEVLIIGNDKHVNLKGLLEKLYDRGITRVLLEGGGTLAWGMLKNNLIDELRLFINPILCGGKNSTSLIMGEGFKLMKNSRKFNLESVQRRNSFLILKYLIN